MEGDRVERRWIAADRRRVRTPVIEDDGRLGSRGRPGVGAEAFGSARVAPHCPTANDHGEPLAVGSVDQSGHAGEEDRYAARNRQ